MRTMIRTNNNITLVGRVTKVKEFGKDVAAVTIAVDNGKDREGKELPSTFVETKCFTPSVYNNLKTGMLVMIAAHLRNNNYEKDGQKIYALDIVADSIEFLESKAVVDARENAKQAAIEEAAKAAKKTRKRKSTKKAEVA